MRHAKWRSSRRRVPACRHGASRPRCRVRGAAPLGVRRVPRGELRRADRPSGGNGGFPGGLVRSRRRDARRRDHGQGQRGSRSAHDGSRAHLPMANRPLRRRAGSRAPFDRYLFQVAAVGDGYGGLEHRSSTSLCCKRDELPPPGMEGVTDDYRKFLGLASHEYFHSWNVKRIKPAAFVPYDLARESYTRQLWAFEGITSYYDDLTLVRCGVIDAESYLELLGAVDHRRAEKSRSACPEPRRLELRCMDQVLPPGRERPQCGRQLLRERRPRGARARPHAPQRRHIARRPDAPPLAAPRRGRAGVPEDGIEAIATELAGREPRGFFRALCERHRRPAACRRCFAGFGVALNLRPPTAMPIAAESRAAMRATTRPRRRWIGASLAGGAEATLQHVFTDGPAERAGLAAGDVIVAIDGIRASVGAIEKSAAKEARGRDRSTMHAFRRDELVSTAADARCRAGRHVLARARRRCRRARQSAPRRLARRRLRSSASLQLDRGIERIAARSPPPGRGHVPRSLCARPLR